VYGILQSAGLLFFAFAGYARIATMGEEVKDPRRTIPRAIVLALGLAVGQVQAHRLDIDAGIECAQACFVKRDARLEQASAGTGQDDAGIDELLALRTRDHA
jgi:hypothetical protein